MSYEFRCTSSNFAHFCMKDDDISTESSTEQMKVEHSVDKCYSYFRQLLELESEAPLLDRQRHIAFLLKGLHHLSESYESLDASRPWICYWILHALELLDVSVDGDDAIGVVEFLSRCQHPDGGYGGGPMQLAHLAPTYAAICALCIIGTEHAYQSINRKALASFLMRMHSSNGAFTMHSGGEVDIRGAYCAAVVARLTGIATKEMFSGTAEWVVRCQTYEGGFAGCPGLEAHGGYSFCGLATLVLLGKSHLCDIQSLLRWTAFRQMPFEGGFQGRTNKLVDGCYSFWQGGAFPIIHSLLAKEGDEALSLSSWMFDHGALQEYILICCQYAGGGLIDKPGKSRDFYHTSYCLSGLSVAQHFNEGSISSHHVIGPKEANELKLTHPLFNIGVEVVQKAHAYFEPVERSPTHATGDDLNSVDS